MMKRWMRWSLMPAALAMIAFRWIPGLAAWWQSGAVIPALRGLHRATKALPFPTLEPLALILPCLGLGSRRFRWVFPAAFMMYALLWYPGYWAQTPNAMPVPDAAALETLCVGLIDELEASPMRFESPFEEAGCVAGLPEAVVKSARYPEWMRALGISGLFSPWTGEAIVDGNMAEALLPFTCVHELMHLKGIADEGSANIAAYVACVDHGGMFAASARLWALRYALKDVDHETFKRLVASASPSLSGLLVPAEGPRIHPLMRLMGLEAATSSYDSLVRWLCMEKTPAA